ncbi:MAG: hypothetical protein NTY15_14780 [Planctomycetota bacterium]|nr:hypothetical protein [Planctomycetota bacterium]
MLFVLASYQTIRTTSFANYFTHNDNRSCFSVFLFSLLLHVYLSEPIRADIVWTVGTVVIQKSNLRTDQPNLISVPVFASSVQSFKLSGYNFSFEVGSDNVGGVNSVIPHGITFTSVNPSHIGASNSALTAGWNLDTNPFPTQMQRQGTDLVIASNIPNGFTEIEFMGSPKHIFSFEFTVPGTITAGTVVPINWAPSLDDPAFADELLNEHSYNSPTSRPFVLNNGALIVAVPESSSLVLILAGIVTAITHRALRMRRLIASQRKC